MKNVQLTVAFGPENPRWGSWNWVGADLARELDRYFSVSVFQDRVPDAQVVVFIKHPPPEAFLRERANRSIFLYCPIDYFGSAREIDAHYAWLRWFHRVVVHCHRLTRYLTAYTRVEFLDHHVKFIAPLSECPRLKSYILWVGVWSNLPPLVAWVNKHALPAPLRILTNWDDPERMPTPDELGFARGREVTIHRWSAETQVAMTQQAWAAIDIKGDDFRARHKPPAKALDFIASGLPLAMNLDSCVAQHLAAMGFEIAAATDHERWLSESYLEETRRFGLTVRESLSLERVGDRFRNIIEAAAAEG